MSFLFDVILIEKKEKNFLKKLHVLFYFLLKQINHFIDDVHTKISKFYQYLIK